MCYIKKIFSRVTLTFLFATLHTCAGEVEGPADCPVDCGNAIPAVMGTTIKPLVGGVTINCHGSVVPKVVELLFLVTAASTAGGGAHGGGEIARQSISYRPVFNGSYDPTRNDHEEAEYKGIDTPKDEWCSSSCGIAKINIWPQCEEGTTLTHSLYVISGNVASEEISITMTDTTAEGGG